MLIPLGLTVICPAGSGQSMFLAINMSFSVLSWEIEQANNEIINSVKEKIVSR
jgi:hypothetical protein